MSTASSLVTGRLASSQCRALTWLVPTSPAANPGAVRIEPRVVHHQSVDGVDARFGCAFDTPDRGRIEGVRAEDEPVSLAVLVDEIEERLHRGTHPMTVVGGTEQGPGDPVHHRLGVGIEYGEVQVELAWKVLVENRFAYPGVYGDLVHPRRVVAAFDEDLAGGVQ